MQWRVECKYSGKAHGFECSFDEAIREACEQCTTDYARWVVWSQPANIRMAEVTLRGCCWVKTKLCGEEVKALMRRCHKTIAALSFEMGITQKRIRQVRERGLEGSHVVRDWLQAITGQDPGPLPERYWIGRHSEQTQCDICGRPLRLRDRAFRFAGEAFCSVACCRQSSGWKLEESRSDSSIPTNESTGKRSPASGDYASAGSMKGGAA